MSGTKGVSLVAQTRLQSDRAPDNVRQVNGHDKQVNKSRNNGLEIRGLPHLQFPDRVYS